MHLLEYQAKRLLVKNKIRIPLGNLDNESSVYNKEVILKVQLSTGNRHSGVVKVESASEFQREIRRLQKLEIKGYITDVILAEEVIEFDHEHYFSLLVDPVKEEIRLLARTRGGVDVEEANDAVLSEIVTSGNIDRIAKSLREFYGFDDLAQEEFVQFLQNTFDCLMVTDALLLEINPLVMVDGMLVAPDCKMEIKELSEEYKVRTGAFCTLIGDPKNWGQGLGSYVKQAACNWAFSVGEFEVIEAKAYVQYTRSWIDLEKHGYHYEGIEKGEVEGQPMEWKVYTLSKNDWEKLQWPTKQNKPAWS